MKPVAELREIIRSSATKANEQLRFDDAVWLEAAQDITTEIAESMTAAAQSANETVRMIDVALKAKPMARAGALKKARSVALRAAQEAAKVAEAV